MKKDEILIFHIYGLFWLILLFTECITDSDIYTYIYICTALGRLPERLLNFFEMRDTLLYNKSTFFNSLKFIQEKVVILNKQSLLTRLTFSRSRAFVKKIMRSGGILTSHGILFIFKISDPIFLGSKHFRRKLF